ncbi:MAG: hypothetical protein QUV02_02760 [Maricaulis sp.]|uniref:hypothetical protein n=1 Tax=Maricaulis sp. TaxID=1486257 RepID=UPI00262E9CB6|nr:hypothetical protein [Maricaulis sp.]MDM7983343.1 hypothetical protein [Maricaulis sp.]
MSEAPKRLGWLWVILATVIVAVFGFVSMGLWMPAVMMFDTPGSADKPLVWLVSLLGIALVASAICTGARVCEL